MAVQYFLCFLILLSLDNAFGSKHTGNNTASTITVSEKSKPNDIIENSKHILLYHPWTTRSHMMQQTSLLRGLLEKGYHVTAVFPYPTGIDNPRYEEILVEDAFAKVTRVMTESMINKDSTSLTAFLSLIPKMSEVMMNEIKGLINLQENLVQRLSSENKSVDALVITVQFAFTATHLYREYKCPLIGISPPGWAPRISKYLGNSENPAYQPDQVVPFIEPLSFWERLTNTVFYVIMDYDILGWLWFPLIIDLDVIGLSDYHMMIKSMDLLLMCSHFVTHSPRALTANTVEVGGIHCREGKPLPQDLQDFLDDHPEGVIYVSFDSSPTYSDEWRV